MVTEIVAAVDGFEADDVGRGDRRHGRAAGVLCRCRPRQPRRGRRRAPGRHLRGVPARRPQLVADDRGGERRCRRRRHEPRARLRRAASPARRARFDTRFLQLGLHPGGGHTWMLRQLAGPQTTMATVVFGDVLDGEEAERVGLAYRCVDDDELLAGGPRDGRPRRKRAARARRSRRSRRSLRWPPSPTIPPRCATELDPQLWSTRQPWFAERIAALQAKISASLTGGPIFQGRANLARGRATFGRRAGLW